MYSLSLQGCPSAETIPITCQVWAETLWNGSTWSIEDQARIAQTFAVLTGNRRWPVPADFRENLPPREPVLALEHRLSAEEREFGREKVRELVGGLAARKAG